jgi:hypothetical protein
MATPPRETSPAAGPWHKEREIRYIMFGPGVRAIPMATSAKASQVEVAGMSVASQKGKLHDTTLVGCTPVE